MVLEQYGILFLDLEGINMVITIRNVSPDVGLKLSHIAKKKKISREEYLRELLLQVTIEEDLKIVENKYENLVRDLADMIEVTNQQLEMNNMLLERVMSKL